MVQHLSKAAGYFVNVPIYFLFGQQCDNIAGRIISAGGERFSHFTENTTPNGTFTTMANIYEKTIIDLDPEFNSN